MSALGTIADLAELQAGRTTGQSSVALSLCRDRISPPRPMATHEPGELLRSQNKGKRPEGRSPTTSVPFSQREHLDLSPHTQPLECGASAPPAGPTAARDGGPQDARHFRVKCDALVDGRPPRRFNHDGLPPFVLTTGSSSLVVSMKGSWI